ncbi:MAG: hypothetical protein L3J28_04960 [Candidatus Polarisedimenticolaceae bacterium]|nr:hypothetical protein [Candidatus Polarisedimenticolaceae bacterium]
MKLKQIIAGLLLILLSLMVVSAESASAKNETLDGQIQNLKREVLKLNRNLFLLQEELLFPGSSQFSVFLSLDIGQFFKLDSVSLKIDGKTVANHLYTQRELQALTRGAVQQLYLGNIKSGQHELVAFFTGVGPDGRDSQRAASLNFDKRVDPKFIELKVIDQSSNGRAIFEVKEW